MSFLIPAARPNPSGIARFGRLLHWCALALAAMVTSFGMRRRSTHAMIA